MNMLAGLNVVAVTISVLLDPEDGKYYLSFWLPGADEPYDGLSELDSLDDVLGEASREIRTRLRSSFDPGALLPEPEPKREPGSPYFG